MKNIMLLFLLLLTFLFSCKGKNEDTCSSYNRSYFITTNKIGFDSEEEYVSECDEPDCQYDFDCEKDQFCDDGYCKSNPCYNKNCKNGKCVLTNDTQSKCICDEGAFLSGSVCLPLESCSDSSECHYQSNEGVRYGSCVTGNKCFYRCQNDDDCVNKDEYCINTGYNEYNLSVCFDIEPCSNENQYFDFYSYMCLDKCSSERPCRGDFICTSEGECVKPCETNEDCINYKWAKGPVCNTETKTCGN